MTNNSKITIRSQIEMRWSTSPEHMGYGRGSAPDEIPGPSFRGTPRAVLAEVARVQHNVGQGTYMRVDCCHRGQRIDLQQVRDVVTDAEFRDAQRGR